MIELFQESMRPVNLPYTVLFGLSALYWFFYVVGAAGADLLDIDMGDVDAGNGFILDVFTRFFYAADVPVTVIGSVLSLWMWVLSVLLNYYTDNSNGFVAAALAIPIFGGGLLLTKLAIMPFVPLLKRAFDESGDVIPVLGKLCIVTSLEVTGKHGQAEVPQKGSPLVLNVKARDGAILKKGDEAVVFARDDDGTYIIAPFEGVANKTGGVGVQ